jgi:hypothetical protein
MTATAERGARTPETETSPENSYVRMSALQARMAAKEVHIEDIDESKIKEPTLGLKDADYKPYIDASNHERREYWKNKGTYDEKMEQWKKSVESYVKSKKGFFASDEGVRIAGLYSELGLRAESVTDSSVQDFYNRYFDKNGDEKYSSNINVFVSDIVEYYSTRSLDAFKEDAPEIHELSRVFGENMAEVIPQQIELGLRLNNEHGKKSVHKDLVKELKPEETKLLNFLKPFVTNIDDDVEDSPLSPASLEKLGESSNPSSTVSSGHKTDHPNERDPIRTGHATWKNKDADQPVIVTGSMGIGPDGRQYVSIEGFNTGIPLDELKYSDSEKLINNNDPGHELITDPHQLQQENNTMLMSIKTRSIDANLPIYGVLTDGTKVQLERLFALHSFDKKFIYTTGGDEVSTNLIQRVVYGDEEEILFDRLKFREAAALWGRKDADNDNEDSDAVQHREESEQGSIKEKIIAGKGFEVISEIGWDAYRKKLETMSYVDMIRSQFSDIRELGWKASDKPITEDTRDLNRQSKARFNTLSKELWGEFNTTNGYPFSAGPISNKFSIRGVDFDMGKIDENHPLLRMYFSVYTKHAPEAYKSLFEELKEINGLREVDLTFFPHGAYKDPDARFQNNAIIIYAPNPTAETMQNIAQATMQAKAKHPEFWQMDPKDEAAVRKNNALFFNIPLDATTGFVEMTHTESYDHGEKLEISEEFKVSHEEELTLFGLESQMSAYSPTHPGKFRHRAGGMKFRRKYMPGLIFRDNKQPVGMGREPDQISRNEEQIISQNQIIEAERLQPTAIEITDPNNLVEQVNSILANSTGEEVRIKGSTDVLARYFETLKFNGSKFGADLQGRPVNIHTRIVNDHLILSGEIEAKVGKSIRGEVRGPAKKVKFNAEIENDIQGIRMSKDPHIAIPDSIERFTSELHGYLADINKTISTQINKEILAKWETSGFSIDGEGLIFTFKPRPQQYSQHRPRRK